MVSAVVRIGGIEGAWLTLGGCIAPSRREGQARPKQVWAKE